MVLGYIRLFGNLTLRKHIVILLTTFGVPISVELVQGLIATGFCGSCVHFGWLAFYFGVVSDCYVALRMVRGGGKSHRGCETYPDSYFAQS